MITFHNEAVTFNLKNKTRLKTWITSTIVKKKRKPGDVSFIFCSDEFLLEMNKQYLDHDTYTDIITFDYSKEDPKQAISGEIYVSIDRVKENAEKFSKTFEEELHRVIIHGVLHLLGHSDKTKAAKEEMRKQEDIRLKGLSKL
ncbi:MAG: rRNA maturation RNase YbeY [Bacteroidetes bacterium]|nr:rRNA maturation RNase YbeY [Bacteroidota bacterium]